MPSYEFDKGKGKAYIENVKNEMNKTWRRKEDCNTSSVDGITSSDFIKSRNQEVCETKI